MFYFGRASQGAEGRVYPYPLYDTLTDRQEERTYRIVYLENEFRADRHPARDRRAHLRGRGQEQRLRLLLPSACHQTALIGLIGA